MTKLCTHMLCRWGLFQSHPSSLHILSESRPHLRPLWYLQCIWDDAHFSCKNHQN